MKDFKITPNFILSAAAATLGIIAVICYCLTGTDVSEKTPTYVSAIVYVPIIIAALLNAVSLFVKDSMVKMGAFAAYFLAFALWIFNQAGYIVNVLMGIDGNTFSFGYIVAIVAIIAGMILSVLSAIRFKKKS